MKRLITGYHTDSKQHWVAELDCGHNQHVRHDPPFFPREWVTTDEGRQNHLGNELNCVRCDELLADFLETIKKILKSEIHQSLQTAELSGLCGEGQLDFALDAINSLDVKKLLGK